MRLKKSFYFKERNSLETVQNFSMVPLFFCHTFLFTVFSIATSYFYKSSKVLLPFVIQLFFSPKAVIILVVRILVCPFIGMPNVLLLRKFNIQIALRAQIPSLQRSFATSLTSSPFPDRRKLPDQVHLNSVQPSIQPQIHYCTFLNQYPIF